MVTKKNISYLAVALTIHVHCSDNSHKNISLHQACDKENNIKCLAENKADINAKDDNGNTPLYLACTIENNREVIKSLKNDYFNKKSEHKEFLSNAKMLLQIQDSKSYIEEKKYTFDGFNKITQFLHHPNSN